MLSFSEKEEFENKKKNPDSSSFKKKNGKKIDRILEQSKCQGDNRISKRKAVLSGDSPAIRKEKVEEAKKKKQNGDYDSREVYKKIADRLMDLFGI